MRAQVRALVDAEAVLLVDDRHRQVREPDRLGQQRVRADQDVDLAGFELSEDRTPVGRGGRSREQCRAHAGALEHRPDRERVLLGQQLGRGHQRALLRARDGHQHRVERDHGFARAHVALDQPVGGRGRREVGGDLAHHRVLLGREREGEA